MSIEFDPPNNGKPDINQYINPEPPAYINPPKSYDFPSPPNGPPRFADPPAYGPTPKEVVEGLLSTLSQENKEEVVEYLDNPRRLIQPASKDYDKLMKIQTQIPLLKEEDKQYFKTIIGRRGGRRKRTRRSKSRRRRNSRRKSRRR
jgi:hypothetical protein